MRVERASKIASFTNISYCNTIGTQIPNWSQSVQFTKMKLCGMQNPGQKTAGLCPARVTTPTRHSRSGLWTVLELDRTVYPVQTGTTSVSNGSSFGPGRFYRSAWQRPYPIKNRRFFKRTITLRPQILIREFSVWYVKYAAQHGASFGRLRFSISSNLCKW